MVVLRRTLQSLLVVVLLPLAFFDFRASQKAMFSLKEEFEEYVFNFSPSTLSSSQLENSNIQQEQKEREEEQYSNSTASGTPVLLHSKKESSSSSSSSSSPNHNNNNKNQRRPQPQQQQQQQKLLQQRKSELPDGFIKLLQEDPKSWLQNLEFGAPLGSGAVSTTVVAKFINTPDDPKQQHNNTTTTTTTTMTNQQQQPQYVVKIAAGDNERHLAAVGVEAVSRLSPHPSIPETLHFVPKVDMIDLFGPPNNNAGMNDTTILPSKEEDDDDDDDDDNVYDSDYGGGYKQFWKGIDDDAKARLYRKGEISIIVEERKFPTHRHDSHFNLKEGGKHLIIPPSLIKCFFRRLFQVLDYAHQQHNVMLRDINLNNMMLSDGELILFDWNLAKIYHPDRAEKVFLGRLRNTGPPENRSARLGTVYVNAHAWDVWVIGERIIGMYLTYQTKLEQQVANNNNNKNTNTTKSASLLLSRTERDKLEDLKNQMMVLDPAKRPTLGELLTNHTYFLVDESGSEQNCTLKW